MIRLFLLVIAALSGLASIWMFATRPEPASLQTPTVAEVARSSSTVVETADPVAAAPSAEAAQFEVLVARRPLPARHVLTSDDIQWALVEAGTAPDDSYLRSEMADAAEEVVGQVSVNQLDAGEILRQSRVQQGRPENLSMLLQAGKRAVSIVVSEEVMAGGFILPGDHVDIFHVRPAANNTSLSRILARNVKVIALDQNTSGMIAEASYISRTATLEVDASDVAAIAAAQSTGRLILALRSVSESDETDTIPQSSQEPLSDSQPRAVRIIRNGEVETLMVTP